jgi:hypothetical protein
MTGMRIVAPYRPFPPEADHHLELAAFDWVDAIRMMSHSAEIACQCPVHVLTDVDTDLPMPAFRYVTTERRLMLWYLEVAACYLASDDFDRDTVMLDSDQLLFQDLSPWFAKGIDFSISFRPNVKHRNDIPILNGVQFWAKRAQDRLVAFYRQALAIARTLPEERVKWGADSDALRILLAPLIVGVHLRHGLLVRLLDSNRLIDALSQRQIRQLELNGQMSWPTRAVLDFRNTRKHFMRRAYEATICLGVPA